jgi:4'-phosphopantetheinyl transferase
LTSVTVWLATLRGPSMTELLSLSPDELERAKRLRSDRDRGRWVAARAFQRSVLARSIGADPAALAIEVDANGKPLLAGGPRFSLAHSAEHALLAVCADTEVGADIELVRADLAQPPSVERYFSDAEREALERLPKPERVRRFFQLWTAKEAYRKATGEGIARGLLGALPEGSFVLDRPPAPAGYEAAVVVLAREAVFSFRSWP